MTQGNAMRQHSIRALLSVIMVLYTTTLKTGIRFINYGFVDDLIEQHSITIGERAITRELKEKLNHNPYYIHENTDLLEGYVRLYHKHKKGKDAIKFLLSKEDGRAQYKQEFIDLAPFMANIMEKKRRRSDILNPLYEQTYSTDFSDDFFWIPSQDII